MSIDFKKLRNFTKIVDAGSMSRASGLLRTAQPALSQQLAVLENHFKQQLLIRSNHGVVPTAAGMELYRHAQVMLRQLDQAQRAVSQAAIALTGQVSVGLATYGASSTLSLPLLKAVNASHPGLVVYINDSFGQVLSESVMNGRMDMAVLYGSDPIKGVILQPMYREELVLVSPTGAVTFAEGERLPVSALRDVRLLLPGRTHFLRRVIDAAMARAKVTPNLFAEIDSTATLSAAVRDGLGSTILPWSAARSLAAGAEAVISPLNKPTIEATVSLGVSDHLPLSEAAGAIRSILLKTVADLIAVGQDGIRAA